MAETIRTYLTNPNYLKTVVPKTVARIRAYVNDNRRLKQTIQFNSVAPVAGTAGVGGAGLLSTSDSEEQ